MLTEHYIKIIDTFLAAGYECKLFSDEIEDKKMLLLRHDIDFDMQKALDFAYLEHDRGVFSTYFIMLRTKSYNVLTRHDFDAVKTIQNLGHAISLHFDPTLYEDYRSGLLFELDVFERFFGISPSVISIHRPAADFLSGKEIGISHTYEPRFFRDIKYISDSGGHFKYGHPLDSDAFAHKQTVHLLTHPIWWTTDGVDTISKLRAYYELRCQALSEHFAANCLPWKQYLEGRDEI